jgi:hypothetical protein
MKSCINRLVLGLLCLAGTASASFAQCDVTSIGTGTYYGDYFGGHLAADGNYLVVGLEGYNTASVADAGAVRVYTRQWEGFPYVAGQLLTEGAAAANGNSLGRSVDIDMESAGGTIVAGAPMENYNGAMNSGTVRIFQPVFGNWTMIGTIQNPFPTTFDQFGYAVALDGDDLLIGAPGDDTAGTDKGAVYAYRRVNGAWTLIDTLTRWQLGNGCRMGEVIDVKGGWALVGVPRYQDAGHTEQGLVLVYQKDASGHWQFFDTWGAGNPDGSRTGAAVGVSLAYQGFQAAYSMPGKQAAGVQGVGEVVVRQYDNGSWVNNLTAVVHADEPTVTGFGTSLSLEDSSGVVIGASGGNYRAFLYEPFWPLVRIPATGEANSALGAAVAGVGDTVIVGDPNATSGAFTYAGKTFVHEWDHYDNGADSCEWEMQNFAFPGYTYMGCTRTASTTPAAELGGVCGYSQNSRDMWIKVLARPSSPMIVDTIGSEFDTVLAAYTTCPGHGGTVVACDDDGAGQTMSRLVLPAQPLHWYSIRIAGYNGANGAYTLHVERGCGTADFNSDGDVGTDQDIEAFFNCLAGNCCTYCGSADFNADGDVGTDADIESFFRVLGGGAC